MKLLSVLLLFIPFSVYAQMGMRTDTLEVELLINPLNGEVITAIDEDKTVRTWVEMLIRGTHGLSDVPFDSVLFSKYFWRVVQYENGRIDTVTANTNFRQHQKQSGIKKAWDVPKVNLWNPKDAYKQAIPDIKKSIVWTAMGQTDVEGAKRYLRWPWGSKERKLFATIISSFSPSEFKSLMRPDTLINAMGDTVFVRPRVKVIIDSLRTNFGLDRTIGQILSDPNEPNRLKQWLQKNVVNQGVPLSTSLSVLISNKNIDKRFLRWKKARSNWFLRQ